MNKFIKLFLFFMLLAVSILIMAAVFTPIGGDHVSAPLDLNNPILEMNMHTEERTGVVAQRGYQDQLLKGIGSGWDVVALGNTGMYGGVNKETLYYYEIEGQAYWKDNNTNAINIGQEGKAVDIIKAFNVTIPAEQPGLADAKAIWNSSYSADMQGGVSSYNYLRISKAVLKVRYYDAFSNATDHIIMNEVYHAEVQAAETGMLIGANYFLAETTNHLKTRVCQVANAPAKLLFGIWLPKFFKFVELSNKVGIKIFGLTCPDQIRVVFYRVTQAAFDSNAQIQDIASSDKIALNSLTLVVNPVSNFLNIVFFYNGPANTCIFDAIGDQTNTPGDKLTGSKKQWTHLYRLEYKFGAVWKYGITRKVETAADTKCNNYELIFSPLQGRFKGTL